MVMKGQALAAIVAQGLPRAPAVNANSTTYSSLNRCWFSPEQLWSCRYEEEQPCGICRTALGSCADNV